MRVVITIGMAKGYTLVQMRWSWRDRGDGASLVVTAAPADAFTSPFRGLIELDVDGRAAPAIAELRAIAAEVPLPDKPVSIFPASFVEGSAWSRRRPCVTCGVDMIGTGSFCCDPCAAENKRRHLKPRIARKREVRIFACLQCGNEFTPKLSTARFCTTRCRVAAHYWRQRAGPA